MNRKRVKFNDLKIDDYIVLITETIEQGTYILVGTIKKICIKNETNEKGNTEVSVIVEILDNNKKTNIFSCRQNTFDRFYRIEKIEL